MHFYSIHDKVPSFDEKTWLTVSLQQSNSQSCIITVRVGMQIGMVLLYGCNQTFDMQYDPMFQLGCQRVMIKSEKRPSIHSMRNMQNYRPKTTTLQLCQACTDYKQFFVLCIFDTLDVKKLHLLIATKIQEYLLGLKTRIRPGSNAVLHITNVN